MDDDDFEQRLVRRIKAHGDALVREGSKRSSTHLAWEKGFSPAVRRATSRPHASTMLRALALAATPLVVVAIGLAIVGSWPGAAAPSSTPPSALGTGTPLTRSPAPSPSMATPSATPEGAGVALCEARSLAVQAVRNGETGVVNVGVGITNRGPRACALPDQPSGVELVRADGQALDVGIEPPPSPPSARIVLPPGVQDAATLTFYWMNWCQAPPGGLETRITFATIPGAVSGPLRGSLLPRCDAPKQPSTIQIDGIAGGGG